MKRDIILKLFALVIAAQLIAPQEAYAYIDPGTGSMILQIIAASIIGIGITCRAWVDKAKVFLFRGNKHNDK